MSNPATLKDLQPWRNPPGLLFASRSPVQELTLRGRHCEPLCGEAISFSGFTDCFVGLRPPRNDA